MTKITTLFFDVGGVCLTNGWDHLARERAAQHFAYDFVASEKQHEQIIEDFECGRVSMEEYLEKIVFYEPRTFTKEAYVYFMESQSMPFESSLNLLAKLARKKRYLLATLNNESLALNLYRIQTFRLHQYFTAFFSSCFLGIKKPDPLIFSKGLWITQQKAEESLFVDDREENVATAKACGLQAVHLQDAKDLAEVLDSQGISF